MSSSRIDFAFGSSQCSFSHSNGSLGSIGASDLGSWVSHLSTKLNERARLTIEPTADAIANTMKAA